MKKFKIKKNDKVQVMTGKDKGKFGTVTKVLRDRDRLVVSGVNLVKKHLKATQASAAGIVQVESTIHISNVAVVCPKSNLHTKVGYKMLEDGKKVRVAKKTGEILDN
jgi:large subunit ribosomal protein L24